jgi:hypothetical protein
VVGSAGKGGGGAFVVPRPGFNGALAGSFSGKTFVLTGVFPELGGGAGLDMGKARCIAMIESFGGRVTGSVSGKTNYLVVGRSPGASKVSKAMGMGVPTVDVAALKRVLEGGAGASLADAPAAHIGEFSKGVAAGRSHARAMKLPDFRSLSRHGVSARHRTLRTDAASLPACCLLCHLLGFFPYRLPRQRHRPPDRV